MVTQNQKKVEHTSNRTSKNLQQLDIWEKILERSKTSGFVGSSSQGELKVTKEEAARIEQALQEEEFRKLLSEYVDDISDPRHRAEQNEYIRYLEQQNASPQGKKLIRPKPGFVLKLKYFHETTPKSALSRVESLPPPKKLFVNIVTSVDIQPPSLKDRNLEEGTSWSIPYTVGPMRTEHDTSKQNLVPTYDCCFHPNALTLAESNAQFKEVIVGVARQGVLKQMKSSEYYGREVKIDDSFYRVLKGKTYISNEPTVLVVSNSALTGSAANTGTTDPSCIAALGSKDKASNTSNDCKVDQFKKAKSHKASAPQDDNSRSILFTPQIASAAGVDDGNQRECIIPNYSISERGVFDIAGSDAQLVTNKASTRPQFLVVRINLPTISSISELDLEVSEERLVLTSLPPSKNIMPNKSPGKHPSTSSKVRSTNYALSCKLPYSTWADQGQAEWNKAKRVLTVTLPVKQHMVSPKVDDIRNYNGYITSVQSLLDAKKEEVNSSPEHLVSDVTLHDSKNKPKKNGVEGCSSSNLHSRWIDSIQVTRKMHQVQEEGSTAGEDEKTHQVQEEGSVAGEGKLSIGAPIHNREELPLAHSLYNGKQKLVPSPATQKQEQLQEILSGCDVEAMCDITKKVPFETTCSNEDELLMTSSSSSIDFIPSSTYCGSRPGFVFQNGIQGLGYYLDDYFHHHQHDVLSEISPNLKTNQPSSTQEEVSRKKSMYQSQLAVQID